MSECSDERNEEDEVLQTGASYSRLLVDRTFAYLKNMYGEVATYQDVAIYLETTHEMVELVLQGNTTFGKEFFEKLATKNRQVLTAFLRDLIKWDLEQRETL